ncbi:hypothetical protein [Celerinatantimonas yamalensis]|uniref:Uncharacterized protein n=1 Tax=Celerinatantimonas yamalensis TaxID=559956 RepID=A0ABW9GAT5_9GAMM
MDTSQEGDAHRRKGCCAIDGLDSPMEGKGKVQRIAIQMDLQGAGRDLGLSRMYFRAALVAARSYG